MANRNNRANALGDDDFGIDKVTLCISAHPGYFHFLESCLAKWAEILEGHDWDVHIMIDGDAEELDFPIPDIGAGSIRFYLKKTGNANFGRNLSAENAARGWIFYWDADNTPEKEIVDAVEDARHFDWKGVGVLYSWVTDQVGHKGRDPRVYPFIDTASLWRVDAIKHVGGWRSKECCEDWELSCRLKQAGWGSAELKCNVSWNDHGENKSRQTDENWKAASREARSLGIICVMRGDDNLSSKWLDAFVRLEKDNRSIGLTIVSNGTLGFLDYVYDSVKWLSGFCDIERYTVIEGSRIISDDFDAIHNAVGFSYSQAIAATPEDLILTWEDDVIPQSPDALNDLLNIITPQSEYSVVSAAVPLRDEQSQVNASLNKHKWDGQPNLIALGEQTPMGMVSGSFTLWTRQCLEQCPILSMTTLPDEYPLGWDGYVCRRLNQLGYQIAVAGLVKCDHG